MFHSEALSLLWRVLLCLLLTFLPSVAVCAFAIRRGTRSVIWLSMLALAQIGTVGYLAFWLWFAAPWLGHAFSLALPIASTIYLALVLRAFDAQTRKLLFAPLGPMALTGACALMVLAAGFLYGGLDAPLQAAASRFSGPLPADNSLPYLLAKGMLHGRPPIPMFGDWLSSDRPPLQAGIFLSEFAYIRSDRMYNILSTVLQSLWIFSLYPFLCAFRIDLRAIRLTFLICLFSGLILVNSLFVWPKLLAAAYVLAFSALLLSPKMLLDTRRSIAKSVLVGALVAYAALSHGGSAFSILGLVLTVVLLRTREIYSRNFLIILLSCVCFYLPWTLYQKLYDPPGDRLLKWHLAGVIHPTSVPFSTTLAKAYEDLPARQIFDNKISNLETVFYPKQDYWSSTGALLSHAVKNTSQDQLEARKLAERLRVINFFYFTPSLGLLMFGPIALLLRFGLLFNRQSGFMSPALRLSAILYLYTGLTLLVWCLLMFLPGSTINHQGTYAANLTAVTAGVLAFWAVSPWLARVVAILHIFLTFLLYAVYMHAKAFQGHLRLDMLALWLFSLVTIAFIVSRLRSNYDLLID